MARSCTPSRRSWRPARRSSVNVAQQLREAGAALDRAGLVGPFGHVSIRTGEGEFAITPPRPLGALRDGDAPVSVGLDAMDLPAGAPGEAWIHWAVYRSRPEVQAICRAQPEAVLAASASGIALRPLHGHGALAGAIVPVHDSAELVRTRGQGELVAAALGEADVIVLRGNGAASTGSDLRIAVARMWAVEASARLNVAVAAAGRPQPLTADELSYWQRIADEILHRIYDYLVGFTDRDGTWR